MYVATQQLRTRPNERKPHEYSRTPPLSTARRLPFCRLSHAALNQLPYTCTVRHTHACASRMHCTQRTACRHARRHMTTTSHACTQSCGDQRWVPSVRSPRRARAACCIPTVPALRSHLPTTRHGTPYACTHCDAQRARRHGALPSPPPYLSVCPAFCWNLRLGIGSSYGQSDSEKEIGPLASRTAKGALGSEMDEE